MNSGHIAFGTWKIPMEQAAQVVCDALREGFTHIDTAASYANEAAVGEGIVASGMSRQDVYVAGKLWTTRREYGAAVKACKKSLRNLGLEYFDCYLIHLPAPSALYDNWEEMNAQTWTALETLHDEGLARCIGVCNHTPRHLRALERTQRIAPAVDQIECHPGFLPLDTLQYCSAHSVKTEAWSPLGNGELLRNPLLCEIANDRGRSVAQVCLRWCLQHGLTPVTKTVSREHMRENMAVFDFELSDQEMERIDTMPLCGYSGLDPDSGAQFG